VSGFLLHNFLRFGRLLRALGLDVPAGRMVDVAAALEHLSLGRRQDVRLTLRALLVSRHTDLETFDRAFDLFWRAPVDPTVSVDLQPMRPPPRLGPPHVEFAAADPTASGPATEPQHALDRVVAESYSPAEAFRAMDFGDMDEREMSEARRLIAELRWDFGLRRTRRWHAGRGATPDLRRLLRSNLSFGGELLVIPAKQRTIDRRPLVVICDVSGSMERYARMLLYFVYSLTNGVDRVEAFIFATRLTRVTRQLARRRAEIVVPDVPRRTPDWGGGTRIGDALRAFNVQWGRRVLEHGPIVLLISDGWDRGDPTIVRQEAARLQRSCHRLIWLNPLLGSPEYQPLTRGMQAALPFVDDFLPVHNLRSLDALAEHLNRLPVNRPARRAARPAA
jgi:uncharacterized protein with von Willebrand factor type A (vWA) domain